MTEPTATQPPIADLSLVDPDSLTRLFEGDPSLLPDVDLDTLISELRRRADVNKANAAASALEAKPARKKSAKGVIIDAALAGIADKPVEELTLDDLMGDGIGDA